MSNTFRFFMPNVSLMGAGCVSDAVQSMLDLKFRKALVVTDQVLVNVGVVGKVTDKLKKANIDFVVYSGTSPNPTVANVEAGLSLLKENTCDFVVSIGGGSPHDCAKGIALLATNGGSIKDYEGVNKSQKPQLPLIAINTTAGTASEMTRFAVVTDEDKHIKMVIVDKNVTPIIAVNDTELMMNMPKSLTAATGMDALTHAVEAYVSTISTPITDACALKAIRLISDFLPRAVENGQDGEAREMMAHAEYLAGMAFNSASLGYVHAMAHQLGGFYNLPHGVCNAVLLPHVQRFNAKVVPGRLAEIAKSMGISTTGLDHSEAANAAIEGIVELSKKVGIPSGIAELGVKKEDIDILVENALKDATGLTNPIQATPEEIRSIYLAAF
ncbi:L-threonine dehydrogenase [Anaerobium acetethylicum]|uniref:Alcohol dehydrogenase n=1 Tax=Anaerobium acetethylicum TaxID=1619234 RepID=A0A1D3TW48_9FIRM|nr:L-threonine dehydrogenase [Anaerobium acetethylicum]SCP98398.1 alcohol dehydrogenase [Anaerobium acetethylicum]